MTQCLSADLLSVTEIAYCESLIMKRSYRAKLVNN